MYHSSRRPDARFSISHVTQHYFSSWSALCSCNFLLDEHALDKKWTVPITKQTIAYWSWVDITLQGQYSYYFRKRDQLAMKVKTFNKITHSIICCQRQTYNHHITQSGREGRPDSLVSIISLQNPAPNWKSNKVKTLRYHYRFYDELSTKKLWNCAKFGDSSALQYL